MAGCTYSWYPSYGISDTTTAQPIAKPYSTTTYYLTVTDTTAKPYLCKPTATDTVMVTVMICSGIGEFFIYGSKFIYPNPSYGNLQIEYNFPNETTGEVIIYDIYSRITFRNFLTGNNNKFLVPVSFLNNGIYFYEIRMDGKKIKKEKLAIVR